MNFLLPVATMAIGMSMGADEPKIITGGKMAAPPTIDGTVNAAEWETAFAGEGFVEQNTGTVSKYPTKFYAGYDDKNLYFAFICTDPNPSEIKMTEYRRQGNVEADDRIVMLVNPYGNVHGNEYSEFEFNARGGNNAELAGGRADKVEWQGEWETVGRMTPTGYEIEVRIPWKILYPPSGKRRVIINFGRYVARDSESSVFSNIGPQEQMEKNAVWIDVEIPQVKTQNVIQALPFVITGLEDEGFKFKTGVDFRYLPTSQITTLGTINPDFENIEGALLGVEFSRFERLAEERRPFFVEGSQYFGLGGMSAQLFSPQRIGPIDAGVKAFGVLPNELSFGTMITTRAGDENVGVVRLRKGFGRSSVVAGYVWSQSHGLENHAFGVQGNWQGPRWGAFALYNGTKDTQFGDANRVDFDVNYGDGKYFGGTGWQTIDENFFPRFGFAPRTGQKGISGHFGYEAEYRTGPLNSMFAIVEVVDKDRLDGKGVFMRGWDAVIEGQHRNGLEFEVFYVDFDFFDSSDSFGGVWLAYPHQDPYHQIGAGFSVGTAEDEDYLEYGLNGRWRFPNRLTLSGSSQIVTFGNENFVQHVVGLSYELDKFRSIVGRAVITDDSANWYLSYRHSGNKGIEYFVILGDPNADEFRERLIIKLVAPVSFRI
ncbi:MAG: hypothetical protein M3R13_05755 [Armatimonadota bacterium]|nr:hypothetical protein [Armatimonadota bacterium]